MEIDNYNLDDNDNPAWDGSQPENNDHPRHPAVIKTLLKVLTTPVEGWKEVRRYKLTPEQIQSSCFFPLTGIATLSNFFTLFFHPSTPLVNLIVSALITFTAFFLSPTCILLVLRLITPADSIAALEDRFGRAFILIVLCSLALFDIPYQLMPMLDPVLVFLPIWSIFILSRGMRFLKINRRREMSLTIILSILTVGMPILLEYILSLILPYSR